DVLAVWEHLFKKKHVLPGPGPGESEPRLLDPQPEVAAGWYRLRSDPGQPAPTRWDAGLMLHERHGLRLMAGHGGKKKKSFAEAHAEADRLYPVKFELVDPSAGNQPRYYGAGSTDGGGGQGAGGPVVVRAFPVTGIELRVLPLKPLRAGTTDPLDAQMDE